MNVSGKILPRVFQLFEIEVGFVIFPLITAWVKCKSSLEETIVRGDIRMKKTTYRKKCIYLLKCPVSLNSYALD